MKILSICNQPEVCGGTLRCALDIIAALPDCEHTLQVVQKGAPAEFFDAVDPVAEAVTFRGKFDCVADPHDLVICHNTAQEFIPLCRGPVIYYAHSVTRTAKSLPSGVDARLCVSRWLADRLGWDHADVLYQPVTVPPKVGPGRSQQGLRIGRICTPNPRKWNAPEWVPHFTAVANAFPEARIDLVGVPEKLFDTLPFRDKATRHTASPEARSLLHEWDVLLYTSKLEESFGRVVREAQRCGCYPVVSARGGFVEQVAGGYGSLVETPEDAVTAIKDFYSADLDAVQAHGDAYGSLQEWRDGFLSLLSKL